jgi:endonuclease/exonuclease/phosphatase family metal-dependent hydrolase
MKTLIMTTLTLISLNSFALTLETFNVGLATGFVDLSDEREPKVIEAIKESKADIICLQEAWGINVRKKIAKALQDTYQDIYLTNVYQTTTSSRPSCRVKQLFGKDKFVTCMQKTCGDYDGDDFIDCIIEKCNDPLEKLKEENRECGSALMAKVGKNPLVSMLHLLNPFYRAGLYAYKGSNGLMLISKKPLKNKRLVDFSDISTLNRRQALMAEIDHNGEEVSIACTHLTAALNVPYTGTSANWAEENYNQILRLLDHTVIEEKAVVLGDFNCGAADEEAGLDAELPEACELLSQYFADPVKETKQCTYCESNSINQADNSKGNSLIDHIFLKGLKHKSVKRVYDQKVEIELKKGATMESHLSDHFGMQVELE